MEKTLIRLNKTQKTALGRRGKRDGGTIATAIRDAIDRDPHEPTNFEFELLDSLSQQAQDDLIIMHTTLSPAIKKKVDQALAQLSRLQQKILPGPPPPLTSPKPPTPLTNPGFRYV